MIKRIIVLLMLIFFGCYKEAFAVNSDFWIEVGEEEYVMGPSANLLDSTFLTIKTPSGIRAFSNNHTFFGPTLESLTDQGAILQPEDDFDSCGVWLNSVYKLDENHWIGWYHAEDNCHYEQGGQTHKSMAFTESFDGGHTWTKPNYPNNQILTADTSFNGHPDQDDAGDGRVIKIGDYFYLFFFADAKYTQDGSPDFSQADWKNHIARSRAVDEGRPGTWYKYYNGSFSEPAVGGRSTPVDNRPVNANFIVYNSYLDKYITSFASGKWGFFLNFSSGTLEQDIINGWNKFPVNANEKSFYPQVSFGEDSRVDNWFSPSREGMKQIYSYSSIIASDGNSNGAGQEFYQYYMKLFDGDGFDKRYLMRRKIILHKDAASSYYSKVALISYEKQSPPKTKASTEIAKPTEGYQKKETLGLLLPYEESGFKPLYECYNSFSFDYFISIADPSLKNWEHCESESDTFIRKIGYISITQNSEANVALYRCFDELNSDHFVSTNINCEGKTKESLLGYAFSQVIRPNTPNWNIAVLVYKNAEMDFPGDQIPISNIQGSYFNNRDLSGNPALTRNDTQIDFDWSGAKPAPEVSNENFSVRWVGNMSISSSRDLYFNAEADDGVKVYLDGDLILNEWKPQVSHFYVMKNVLAGDHEIKVEYFQATDGSHIHFFIAEPKHASFQMTDDEIQRTKDNVDKIPAKIFNWSNNAVSLSYDLSLIDRSITTEGNPVKKDWWWASPVSTAPELDNLSNYDSVFVLWPSRDSDFCNYIESCGWGWGIKASDWTRGMTYGVQQGIMGTQEDSENLLIHEWLHGVTGFFSDNGFNPQPDIDKGEEYGYPKANEWSAFYADVVKKKVLNPETGNYMGIDKFAWSSGKLTNLGLLNIRSLSGKTRLFLNLPNVISSSEIAGSFKERGISLSKFSAKQNYYWRSYIKDFSADFILNDGLNILIAN